ncbi:multidrug effflux MFS transporter [Nocardioides euryhalodurans]|uniref:Bcr/CflA family efflux MFS transporter n=1 Tax=Nocardioides euryhalodurans TaxID=2518370 RepID=A0A4P7GJG4_9ACTN|nr:multidrug effflux MFS transporter [Nocardioides euryhalodurans]QBR92150.1 Bcr/CflA family efflux MFS transporter [Nocardioides euryhalodurans]
MTSPADRRLMWLVPAILAGLSMLGPFSIDTPFPAFREMGRDFSVSSAEMQLVVSAYLLAFGLMSPFHGPLSDALGRRPVIVGGVVVYVVASVGCALSPDLTTLLVFRVLQGLSAGGGVIVSRTVVRDMFEGPAAQRLMSRVMMIFGLAPAVAPIIGGLLLQLGAWPVVFWFMAGAGLLLVAVVVVALPETHPVELRTPLHPGRLVGTLLEVTRHLPFHRVAWAAALSFAGQFLYIGTAPIFVVELLGLGELDFWVFFVPMIAGVTIGAWVSGRAAGHVTTRTLITAALVFSTAGAAVNVVLATLPTAASLPWAVLGPALIAVGTAAAYPSLQLTMLDMFPATRGASVSMFTFFTLLLNGLSASALAPFVTGSVLALALASTGMVLAGLLFWVWHLRATSASPRGVPEPVEPTEQL